MKATYGDNKMCLLGHTDLHRMPKRCEAEEKLHRLKYDQMKTEGERTSFAKKLGVKGSYPDMALSYHQRVSTLAVDGMHTIRNVTVNIINALNGKPSNVPGLTLSSDLLAVADRRYAQLVIPSWVDIKFQKTLITNPTATKTHDYHQLVKQRILQYMLRGLLENEDEQVLFELLDRMADLYSDNVDTREQTKTDKMISAVTDFEKAFPKLMVSKIFS